MDFNIDFSSILWIEVKKLGISMEEIHSIFQNPSSSIASFHGEEFIVGSSSKIKFILAAYQIAKNTNFRTPCPFLTSTKNSQNEKAGIFVSRKGYCFAIFFFADYPNIHAFQTARDKES